MKSIDPKYSLCIKRQPSERHLFGSARPVFLTSEDELFPPQLELTVVGDEANNLELVEYEVWCSLAADDDFSNGLKLSPHLLECHSNYIKPRQGMKPIEQLQPNYKPFSSKMRRIKENERGSATFLFSLEKCRIILAQSCEIENNLIKKYSAFDNLTKLVQLMNLEQRINEESDLVERRHSISESSEVLIETDKGNDNECAEHMEVESVLLSFTVFKITKIKNMRPRLIGTVFSKRIFNLDAININYVVTFFIPLKGGDMTLKLRDTQFNYEMCIQEVDCIGDDMPWKKRILPCRRCPSERALIYKVPAYEFKSSDRRTHVKCEILLRRGQHESNKVPFYFRE